MSEWQSIETAPKDGSVIDLWIEGANKASVRFYAPNTIPGKRDGNFYGRACDFRWESRPPNRANWYPIGGLGYPLSPDVTPTHWMPLPLPPAQSDGEGQRSE